MHNLSIDSPVPCITYNLVRMTEPVFLKIYHLARTFSGSPLSTEDGSMVVLELGAPLSSPP